MKRCSASPIFRQMQMKTTHLTPVRVAITGTSLMVQWPRLCTPNAGGLGLILHHFRGGSDGKVSAYNAGDLGSIPGLGGSPAEGNGNSFQYYCLENPMDGGAWLLQSTGSQKVGDD